MRSPRFGTLLLPLAAAPVLLTGCSSSGSDSAADQTAHSTETPESSAAATSDAADAASDAAKKETFCSDVPALLSDIGDDLTAVGTDPTQAQGAMDEAVARISAVQPPTEASAQWTRLVTAWTAMRDLLAQADLTNPQANTDLAPQLQALQTELVDSGTAVDDYGKANC
jgi:hypothetical protein